MLLQRLAACTMRAAASCAAVGTRGAHASALPRPLAAPTVSLTSRLASSGSGAAWGAAWRGSQLSQGSRAAPQVLARSYGYEAAAAEAAGAGADIGEVDWDAAVANSGEQLTAPGSSLKSPHASSRVGMLHQHAAAAAAARSTCRCGSQSRPAPAATVRLIGNVGLVGEMRVFEKSKLFPFSIAVDSKKDSPATWCAGGVWGLEAAPPFLKGAGAEPCCEWAVVLAPAWLAGHAWLPGAKTAAALARCALACRVNIDVWGPLADRAAQSIQKGMRVAVEVRLPAPAACLGLHLGAGRSAR